jgi:hypothetical protein
MPHPQPPNGYIVNTNRAEYPKLEAEERMRKGNCVFVTGGEKDFQPLRQITAGDAVFLYANEVGVISFGTAKGEPWPEPFQDVEPQLPSIEALFLSVKPLHLVNPPITHAEMKELFGLEDLILIQAVTTLKPTELTKLWEKVWANQPEVLSPIPPRKPSSGWPLFALTLFAVISAILVATWPKIRRWLLGKAE